MGSDHKCNIIGIGSIRLQQFDDKIFKLDNVRFAPNLSRNLLYVSALGESGLHYLSRNQIVEIIKPGGSIIMRGKMVGNLYILEGKTIKAFTATKLNKQVELARLWHNRLGHVKINGLKELRKKYLIYRNPYVSMPFCERCIMGKQTKKPFKDSRNKANQILKYLHL